MDAERDSKRSLTIAFATVFILLLAYVASSGPAQLIVKSEAGLQLDTSPPIPFCQGAIGVTRWMPSLAEIYSPLVWIDDTLPIGGALTGYWSLFSDPKHYLFDPNRGEI